MQEGNDLTTLPDGRIIVAPEGNYGTVERIDFVRAGVAILPKVTSIQVTQDVVEDAAAKTLQDKYMNELEAQLATHLTCLAEPAVRPAALGAITSEAFRVKTGADFGWINAGGLRKDLPAGALTLKSAREVLPYDNKVMKIEASASQLRLGLEQGILSNTTGTNSSKGYPLVSGFTYSYDAAAPAGQKVTKLVRTDGTPIEDNALYTLAITNYVAVSGGNDVTAFKGGEDSYRCWIHRIGFRRARGLPACTSHMQGRLRRIPQLRLRALILHRAPCSQLLPPRRA